jgi:hypothetical protein
MRQGGNKEDAALVPKTWELVRRSSAGEESVLAHGVLSYDISPDGTIVYSDGSGVYRIESAGTPQRLCRGKLIERVVSIGV